MTRTGGSTKVVTYQSSRDARHSLCPDCEARRIATHDWPRDWTGEEMASVHHGLHRGDCDDCDPLTPADC